MESLAEPRQPEHLFIGIDQSYTGFGLVVLDETGKCHQKSLLKYPLGKFNNEADRLVKIYDDLLMYFGIHLGSGAQISIGMEGYAYGAKLNREKLGELGGIVKLTSYLVFGITPEIVAPTALKQAITGSGKADKQAMLMEISKLDPDIKDHNLADAYGIALMLYTAH